MEIENIITERLLLRELQMDDVNSIQEIGNAYEIADTTINIPYPYTLEAAEEWIKKVLNPNKSTKDYIFAITRRPESAIIGVIGIMPDYQHLRAEIGYWLGLKYWNKGYCTEAAEAALDFCFTKLQMRRAFAQCFARNPASSRVIEKIGMKYEGRLRNHILKWDKPEDMLIYGILRAEWLEEKGIEKGKV
ncbi:MAG: GNAT family N-acetyltransferase [Acidobacteria bacterium]|nr:GNAT family N-acetyltransferase [Acidobacteriota bacterium]